MLLSSFSSTAFGENGKSSYNEEPALSREEQPWDYGLLRRDLQKEANVFWGMLPVSLDCSLESKT